MNAQNSFRETIDDDGVVLGARSMTYSPTVIESFGILGLDFVWLDFEHGGPSPWDSELFEHLTRAAEAGGIELLVRLPSADPALIRKTLDTGVRNLLIPRVDSAEEVRSAVKATRFRYDGGPGERGLASGRSRRWGTVDDYVEGEEQTVCLGVMIEKMTAVDELDEILSVPELGFVFIGPSDLAVQLGHPTDKTHPDVQDQIADIVQQCADSPVPLGGISHDPDGASNMIDAGYQIVRIGGELESARKTLSERLSIVDGSR